MKKNNKSKTKKVLDPSNACRCGKSGGILHKCPLEGVIPPFDDKIRLCNCCDRCYGKCADEV